MQERHGHDLAHDGFQPQPQPLRVHLQQHGSQRLLLAHVLVQGPVLAQLELATGQVLSRRDRASVSGLLGPAQHSMQAAYLVQGVHGPLKRGALHEAERLTAHRRFLAGANEELEGVGLLAGA